MYARVEQWFAVSESNAAGRLGLYRILYGLWFLWMLPSIDLQAIAARPTPLPAPIGIIAILDRAGAMGNPRLLAYCLALGLGIGLMLLTFGLATRLSTLLVVICSAILFAWDSSYGKVVDKYVLLGSIVPFWMLFSRWGETYSLDALIRRGRGQPTPAASDSNWEYAWPLRAVVIFVAVLYFSAGCTKTFQGTWLHNPYVVVDKLTENSILASVGESRPIDPVIWQLVTHAPAIFILGQYLVLAFELSFPLALVNRDLRTLIFSMAALFHVGSMIILNIAFAPMIIVLAIAVDWQALYARFWPLARLRWNGPSRPLLLGLIGLALTMSLAFGLLLTSHSRTHDLLGFLPKQEGVWYLAAPFAAFAAVRAGHRIYLGLRARFVGPPTVQITGE